MTLSHSSREHSCAGTTPLSTRKPSSSNAASSSAVRSTPASASAASCAVGGEFSFHESDATWERFGLGEPSGDSATFKVAAKALMVRYATNTRADDMSDDDDDGDDSDMHESDGMEDDEFDADDFF